MKKFIIGSLFSIFLFFAACNSEKKIPQQDNFEQLEWLTGRWERTNDQGERKTYEKWHQSSDELYTGMGFTLANEDTVFKENLKILAKNDTLNLIVTGVNENPTYFTFTNQTDSSFVCENERNEFPKKIEYIFSNDQLTATISGGGPTTSFIFRKQ